MLRNVSHKKRLGLRIDGANSPHFYNEGEIEYGIERGKGTYSPYRKWFVEKIKREECSMLPHVYKAFTTYEGMYIGYLIPIVYFSRVTFISALNNFKQRRHAGLSDVIAAIAMILIAADFVNYLYLFFSRAGALLPPSLLYVKYAIGGCLWIWALAYCYRVYFSPRAAGKSFRQRIALFVIVMIASLILSGLGIALLPAHSAAIV